ncbi:MAG: hypothetical protein AAF530_24195 [Pseudomonadota bacterium]
MAFQLADRVKETSISPGAGTANLAGPVQGFQSFVQGVGSGNICIYCMTDSIQWEVGYGLVTAGSPDTLARTTVIKNSDQTQVPINFTGTVDVFVTAAGSKLMQADNNGAFAFLPGRTNHLFRDELNNDLLELAASFLDVKNGVELRIDGQEALTDNDAGGNNGHIRLGPILIVWGTAPGTDNAATAVSFSRAFSDAPWVVAPSCKVDNAFRLAVADDYTSTGCNVWTFRDDGTQNVSPTIRYIAIGPA